jgi:hypothetical protein
MSRRNSLFGGQVLSVPRASCRGGQVADHHGTASYFDLRKGKQIDFQDSNECTRVSVRALQVCIGKQTSRLEAIQA